MKPRCFERNGNIYAILDPKSNVVAERHIVRRPINRDLVYIDRDKYSKKPANETNSLSEKLLWYTESESPALNLSRLDSEIPIVSRINDDILECSIYLYKTVKDARNNLYSGASGFLVYFPSGNLKEHAFIYVVTNKHVLRSKFTVVRLNTAQGESVTIKTKKTDWNRHKKADVAICILPIDRENHKFRALDPCMFVTDALIKDYDIGVGDEAFMVGRLSFHGGTNRNLPAVRFGNISMMPLEQRKGEDFYLVGMHSITGFSGSPVFVHIPPNETQLRPKPIPEDFEPFGVRLLGIDCGHISEGEQITDSEMNPTSEELFAPYNTGTSRVVPVKKLQELFYYEKVVAKRVLIEQQEQENIRRKIIPNEFVKTIDSSLNAPKTLLNKPYAK